MSRPIGLIAPLEEEAACVRSQMIIAERLQSAHVALDCGYWHEHSVVLARCGAGKTQAALAAQLLLDRFQVEALIGLGAAGALATDLEVGDLVVGTEALYHDVGTYTDQGIKPSGTLSYTQPNRLAVIRSFQASPILAAAAANLGREATLTRRLAGGGGRPAQIRAGLIATGDQMVAGRAVRDAIRRRTGAVAVDMEGAAIAHVAHASDVPFLLIRAISDRAEESLAFDYGDFLPDAGETPSLLTTTRGMAKVATHAVRHPGEMIGMMRMRQNFLLAASNAALVTGALLSAIPFGFEGAANGRPHALDDGNA